MPIRTTIPPAQHHNYTNGQMTMDNVFNHPQVVYSQPPKPFNGDFYTTTHAAQKPVKVSSFNLNPLSKPFMPSNIESIIQPEPSSNGRQNEEGDFAGGVYRANLVVKEGYVPKREVRDVNESFIVKRGVSDMREGYVVKREVSNVKGDSEMYAVKSYESMVKSREDNVVKVHQSNLVKVNESSVVNLQEGNEANVQESVEVKAPEDKVMKVSESSSPKVSESSSPKVSESSSSKVSESSLPKVSENKVSKVDDTVKVSDVGKSNSTEATKSGGGFMREQNSVIEKFAEEVTRNGVRQGLELETKVDPVPVIKEVEMQEIQQSFKPARRSWADIVSKGQKPNEKASLLKSQGENEKSAKTTSDQESEGESVAEDNMALALGSKYILFNIFLF